MIPAPMMLTVRLDAAPMMVDLRSGMSTLLFVALGLVLVDVFCCGVCVSCWVCGRSW